MRRATPSMHCSFSPSRSFSFFLPNRMTANESKHKSYWWDFSVTTSRRDSLFCFFSFAAKQSVMPLESSPVWGYIGSLHTWKNVIVSTRNDEPKLSSPHLEISERALNTVLALILTLVLVLFLSVANRSHQRPIIDLKFHRFLKLSGRRRLRWRGAAGVWRRTW